MKTRIKSYLCITAILLILVGGLCMFNPGEGFQSVAWIIGLLILLSGISSLLFGLRAQAVLPNAGSTTLLAMFQIVIGLLFLGNNLLATASLSAIFAMWVLFEGISLGVLSIDYKRSDYSKWWLMLLLGLCSVALGVFALCNIESTGKFLGVILGIGIVANGVVRLVALSAIKRIEGRVRDVIDSARSINIDDINNNTPNR